MAIKNKNHGDYYGNPSPEELERQLNAANDKIHGISKKNNPRFVKPEDWVIMRTLLAKGRKLESIDSSVMSMYIQDNLEQTYTDLVTRLSMELGYNFFDVHNYLKDKTLWYNVRTITNYTIEVWEVEKTFPAWLDKLISNPEMLEKPFKETIDKICPKLKTNLS